MRLKPRYDKRGGGPDDQAGDAVRKKFKVMRETAEERLGGKIGNELDFCKWLVKYAAFNQGRRNKGRDHKTAFARLAGYPYTTALYEPAETVLARDPRPEASADESRVPWAKGVWAGRLIGLYVSGLVVVGRQAYAIGHRP